MKWLLLAFGLTLAAASAGAEIYKWILPNGSIKYSDRPPEKGAERVDLRPLVIIPPLATSVPAETTEMEGPAESNGYDSFTIASPANDATVRSPGSGNISLSFAVSPSLIQGHAIEIFIDGQRFGRSDTSAATLSNVDRGTHQIHAAIIDDAGVELARTETITVHLHR
jgi:hypothetical protein